MKFGRDALIRWGWFPSGTKYLSRYFVTVWAISVLQYTSSLATQKGTFLGCRTINCKLVPAKARNIF